jgi:O-antigen ligase
MRGERVSMAGIRSVAAEPGWGGFLRLVGITVGGILVLQSTDSVDALKVAYLILAAVAIGIAFSRLPSVRHTRAFAAVRPLLIAMVALLAVIAVSLPIAVSNGVSPMDWLRDAAAYALFALVAVVALDAHRANHRALLVLTLAIGALSTASYIVTWLDIRSIADAPLERLVLPSGALASMFFLVTAAYSFRPSRRQILWAAVAGATLGLFLIIGTRGRIPFIALPLVLAAVSSRGIRGNFRSWAVQYIAAAVIVVSVPVLQELTTPPGTPPEQRPTEVIGRRVDSIDDLVVNPGGDASMRERISQTVGAWNVFAANPVVGAGPGLAIEWRDWEGKPRAGYDLDSPVLLLAKFGLAGALAAAGWLIAFGRVSAAVLPRVREYPEFVLLVGQIVVFLYASIFSPPMQDKGMSFALMLVLALVLNRAFSHSTTVLVGEPAS